MKPRLHHLILLATLFTSIATHWNIFNKDLIGVHLWRQIQNQWNIRNFYREDNNILNPRIAAHNLGQEGNILRYEFPLMAWSIAQVERLAGESIVVTRVSMFVFGLLGVVGFYFLLLLLFREKNLAACGAWILSFSPLFYYYTLNPLSDVPAMAAQIWMMVFTIRYFKLRSGLDLIWSAFFLCLAGLFKLPFLVFGIVPLMAILLIYVREGKSLKLLIKSLVIVLIFCVPVILWYTYAIRAWVSMGVLKGIFGTAEIHKLPGYIRFHVFHWLPNYIVNPVSVLFLIAGGIALIKLKSIKSGLPSLLIAGVIACLGYYIYEINMISTVHDYYFIPFLVWLHLLIVYGLRRVYQINPLRPLCVILLAAMPVITYLKMNDFYWHIDRNGYNTDWFTYADNLRKAVPDAELCIFLNDHTGVVFPYQVDKQGYVFDKDDLPVPWIEDMIINRDVKYMYSDSRKVDSSQAVQAYIDTLILEQGSVKVFRLARPDQSIN